MHLGHVRTRWKDPKSHGRRQAQAVFAGSLRAILDLAAVVVVGIGSPLTQIH